MFRQWPSTHLLVDGEKKYLRFAGLLHDKELILCLMYNRTYFMWVASKAADKAVSLYIGYKGSNLDQQVWNRGINTRWKHPRDRSIGSYSVWTRVGTYFLPLSMAGGLASPTLTTQLASHDTCSCSTLFYTVNEVPVGGGVLPYVTNGWWNSESWASEPIYLNIFYIVISW